MRNRCKKLAALVSVHPPFSAFALNLRTSNAHEFALEKRTRRKQNMMFKSVFAARPALALAAILALGSLSLATDAFAAHGGGGGGGGHGGGGGGHGGGGGGGFYPGRAAGVLSPGGARVPHRRVAPHCHPPPPTP